MIFVMMKNRFPDKPSKGAMVSGQLPDRKPLQPQRASDKIEKFLFESLVSH
jgi:hypothetical protein